jgi:rare lipoprotein A
MRPQPTTFRLHYFGRNLCELGHILRDPAQATQPSPAGLLYRGCRCVRTVTVGLGSAAAALSIALLGTLPARAETGLASYYGGRGHPGEMTCAQRSRAFGSMVTVTYQGRSIRCRVNDRGPFVRGRVIDVSVSAARALGMMRSGIVRVSVE